MGDGRDEVLGRGVYSIAEAARLTRLRPRRVNEWFRGRDTPGRTSRPLFQSDYPVMHEQNSISFLDLIELKIGGTLRDMGVSLQYLRKAYERLKSEFGEHPLCRRAIFSGDKQIFTKGMSIDGPNPPIEAITGQVYFDEVILPFLERVEYDSVTDRAVRWRIAEMVVIDPAYRFGSPMVMPVGIPTSTLRNAYYANAESAAVVADWFGIEPAHVMAAVAFENDLAA